MKSLALSRSLALYEEGLQLMPWASQTASKRPTEFALGAFPIYLERGAGARVWDVDGNEYIDYILGLGPVTLGYNYEPVNRAVIEQIGKGVVFGQMHGVEVEAARAMVEAVPGADQVRFFKTGAECTSAAVRVARAYTGRDIVLHCGYHGWLDMVSTHVQPGVPAAFREVLHPFGWDDVGACEALCQRFEGQVAAILLNPVSYHRVSDGQFLRDLRAICDRIGAVLIYDEIVTGFRLALGGAQEYFGVLPDLSCFAKGIANGYPVAVLGGRREVMKALGTTTVSSTYGGDAVALSALVATVREYRDKDVTAFLTRQGTTLMDGLNAAAQQYGVRARWKGYAVMSAYAFEYDQPQLNAECMTFWLQECAKRGVLFRRGGLNFLTLSHDDASIEATLEVGREVLQLLREAVEAGQVADLLETTSAARGRYEQ